jgi:hypothetical protein
MEENDSILKGILKELIEAGLSRNKDKFSLKKEEVELLWHKLSFNKIKKK